MIILITSVDVQNKKEHFSSFNGRYQNLERYKTKTNRLILIKFLCNIDKIFLNALVTLQIRNFNIA